MSHITPENLYTPGDYVIFGGVRPILHVQKITGWNEKIVGTGDLEKEFTYSFDGLTYSDWQSLTNSALTAVPVQKTIPYTSNMVKVYLNNNDPNNPLITLVGFTPINETYKVGDFFPYSYSYTDITGEHFVPAQTVLTVQNIQNFFQYAVTGTRIQNPGDFGNSDFAQDFETNYVTLMDNKLVINYPDEKSCRGVYLKFRYTLLSGGPISIYPITPIVQTYQKEKFAGAKPPVQECSDFGSRGGLVFTGESSYNIYQQGKGLEGLFSDLNAAMNQLIGIPTQYYHFTPIQSSADVILHEWTLYNVDPCCKELSVVVPKNEFPDAKIMWNGFGSDFDMPFEVQVSKEYYESIMGPGKAPQKRDILYFPINNRIYEITSSTLEKSFMQIPIYYRLSLVKHQPKSNTIFTREIKEDYDLKTISSEDIFGAMVDLDEMEITNPQQFGSTSPAFDAVRGFVDPNLSIPKEKILNYYTTVAESFYDLNCLVGKTLNNQVAVQYNKINTWSVEENRAFSAWFRQPTPQKYKTFQITSTSFIGGSGTLIFTSPTDFTIGQEIQLYNSSVAINGIVTSLSPFVVEFPEEVVDYWNQKVPAWQYLNFKSRHYLSKYLINAYNNELGWALKLHTGLSGILYAECLINNLTEYFFFTQELTVNAWYTIHLNMSHDFGELNLNLWQIQWNIETNSNQTTVLANLFSDNRTLEISDKSSYSPYQISASEIQIANIRIWKTFIEKDRQSVILNQNLVKQPQLAIIIDNTNEQSRLPQIGQTN